jgi:Fic family protein
MQLFECPIFNICQLEAALGVPYRTAQRYVEKLEDMGILQEAMCNARNRIYRADEIMNKIE